MQYYKLKPEEKEKHIKEFLAIRKSGKSETTYIKRITISDLSNLFNVSKRTINNWIKQETFNPRALFSICELYSIRKNSCSKNSK